MRIHHLDCISSCPLGGRLMDGRSRAPLVRDHAREARVVCSHDASELEAVSGRSAGAFPGPSVALERAGRAGLLDAVHPWPWRARASMW